jgi:hypothetical protein
MITGQRQRPNKAIASLDVGWLPGVRGSHPTQAFRVSGQGRHQRKQAEQQRDRTSDGQIVSITLGFNTQMYPGLIKGHFNLRASNEPQQDLHGHMTGTGRQKRLWFKLAIGISHRNQANWHVRFAGDPPQANFTVDFDCTALMRILVFKDQFLPSRLAIMQSLFGRKPTGPFEVRGHPVCFTSRCGARS